MKHLPALLTGVVLSVATIVGYLTIGGVVWWACTRLRDTAMPLEEQEKNITLLLGSNFAIGLLAGLASAYIAVQIVYSMKSAYIVRAPIVPYLGAGVTAIVAFRYFDQGPYSVPAWEFLFIDFWLFLATAPVPAVIGLIAGTLLSYRAQANRVAAT